MQAFEVTDFGTRWLILTDIAVKSILITTRKSQRFQVIVGYLPNLRFPQGGISLYIGSGWTRKLRLTKFGLMKLETSLYHVVQNTFRYLESSKCGSRV